MKDLEKLMNQKALEKVASETGNKYLEKISAKEVRKLNKSMSKEERAEARKGWSKDYVKGAVPGAIIGTVAAPFLKQKKKFGAIAGGLVGGAYQTDKKYAERAKKVIANRKKDS